MKEFTVIKIDSGIEYKAEQFDGFYRIHQPDGYSTPEVEYFYMATQEFWQTFKRKETE